MPKIADIQETPNPNAVKFILKEPVSYGTSHSFKKREDATDDTLAKSLFDVGNVVSVFYMDKMVTVEKTDDAEWDEILPELAVPIRAAGASEVRTATAVQRLQWVVRSPRRPHPMIRRSARSRPYSTNAFVRI